MRHGLVDNIEDELAVLGVGKELVVGSRDEVVERQVDVVEIVERPV